MKVKITALLKFNPKIFGSLSPERTKLDLLYEIGRIIREGKGIEEIFIETWEFLPE